MSTLAVEFLEPGMVLARDVRGSNGMVLLGAGAELNERHIGIFRSWGIAEVEIKGAAQETTNTELLTKLDVGQRQRIERELDRLFQHNDPHDPVIEELRRICLLRETARAMGGP
jgi:hypothetical protein